MTTKPFVQLTKVSKIYPPDIMALKEVSLALTRGEMVFLTGLSGAGKSTLLKLLCGMEAQTQGTVEVAGLNMSSITSGELQRLRQQIGVVFQDFRLLPHETVEHNVSLPMEITFTPARTIRQRVSELLKFLGLREKEHTVTAKLSRGEQQRVAIARAVANSPFLLLADEPTGNLDSTMTEVVLELFKKVNARGTTIILASHDENLYRHTHRRILELSQGEIVRRN